MVESSAAGELVRTGGAGSGTSLAFLLDAILGAVREAGGGGVVHDDRVGWAFLSLDGWLVLGWDERMLLGWDERMLLSLQDGIIIERDGRLALDGEVWVEGKVFLDWLTKERVGVGGSRHHSRVEGKVFQDLIVDSHVCV